MRPPAALLEERRAGGHNQRADDESVEQEASGDGEPGLGERLDHQRCGQGVVDERVTRGDAALGARLGLRGRDQPIDQPEGGLVGQQIR